MRYQFTQFAWCHLTLVVVVFTSHFAIVNLFQGLIWMILPSLLIIANECVLFCCCTRSFHLKTKPSTHLLFSLFFSVSLFAPFRSSVFAYICGFFFGRRWIQRGLIDLSPKKTWEGFIGATVITFGFGFLLSRLFASYTMFVPRPCFFFLAD